MKKLRSGAGDLDEREIQICARCYRTRYEHQKPEKAQPITDHVFEEIQIHHKEIKRPECTNTP